MESLDLDCYGSACEAFCNSLQAHVSFNLCKHKSVSKEKNVSFKQSLNKLFALFNISASYIKTCGASF